MATGNVNRTGKGTKFQESVNRIQVSSVWDFLEGGVSSTSRGLSSKLLLYINMFGATEEGIVKVEIIGNHMVHGDKKLYLFLILFAKLYSETMSIENLHTSVKVLNTCNHHWTQSLPLLTFIIGGF